MNQTMSAGAPLKSASETNSPFVSGNSKSGAVVPSGSMVEGVSAMKRIWNDGVFSARANSVTGRDGAALSPPAQSGQNMLRTTSDHACCAARRGADGEIIVRWFGTVDDQGRERRIPVAAMGLT